MRRLSLLAATAVLVAGCSQQEEKRSAEDLRTFDVQSEPGAPPPPPAPVSASTEQLADGAGPNINVTAAPGVAFNYRYAYRLPDARIQAAQEAHAVMCERLTIARCRITGMRYTVSGEDDVRASLELKLDPRIARQFGKNATKVITDAEGMMVDQEISGTDMNPAIEGANRGRAELQDELERVNRELARPGLSNVIRDRLLSEAQSLRAQIRSLGEQRTQAEASLATTPMAFFYGSGEAIPGFDDGRSLKDSLRQAGDNFVGAIGILIVTLATLLPWVLLIASGWWLLRRFGLFRWSEARGYRRAPKESAGSPAEQPA